MINCNKFEKYTIDERQNVPLVVYQKKTILKQKNIIPTVAII